jgi:hypothetical protein
LTNDLIVAITALLLLAGCCHDNDADCTVQQLADKQAMAKRETVPELVAVKDNVRLYRIYTIEPGNTHNHWTYFTTPCGDTSSSIEWSQGKAGNTQIPVDVNGTGCK